MEVLLSIIRMSGLNLDTLLECMTSKVSMPKVSRIVRISMSEPLWSYSASCYCPDHMCLISLAIVSGGHQNNTLGDR